MLDYKIQWLTECESTSRLLKDQTKDTFNEVRVIAAARQTAGSGRLGRGWVSLEGNLHISIALPATFVREETRDLLPLSVGVLVSQWIEKSFAVRACLKWPNDILVDGLKVGGILCEGSFLGSEFKGVVIGIGLNLREVPALTGEQSYPFGSLEQLTGRGMAARLAADSFARFFAERWPNLHRSVILDMWRDHGIADGQLWYSSKSGQREWYRTRGLDSFGNLILESRRDNHDTFVSSSHNEFRWSVQMDRELIVADIGNSRTKVGLFTLAKSGEVSISQVTSEPGDIPGFIKERLAAGVAPVIHALSVNPLGLQELRERTRNLGVDVREIVKTPVRMTRSSYDLKALGADRLALLEALQFRHAKGELPWPAMVVSCGTATTLDCVDGAGEHLGGFILAGLQTALDAMSNRGAMLPKALSFSSEDPTHPWPTNSADAMTRAALDATMAFLKSERQRLADYCRVSVSSVNVVLTGGFADLVHSSWNADFITVDRNLVLLGAGIMAANGG